MPVLLLAAWLLFMPAVAPAQCCGDCGGDGEVSISDLITAVNNALNGCGGASPTPTPPAGQCPIDFQDDNSVPGTPDCYYRGRWNQSCGAADLETVWRSDTDILIINVLGVTGGLFFGAEVNGAGSASVFCWYTQEDASDCSQHSITGDATLSIGGGTLTIAPQTPPFNFENCPFARYSGALFTVDTSAAASLARARRVAPEVWQRLRDAAATRRGAANLSRH